MNQVSKIFWQILAFPQYLYMKKEIEASFQYQKLVQVIKHLDINKAAYPHILIPVFYKVFVN